VQSCWGSLLCRRSVKPPSGFPDQSYFALPELPLLTACSKRISPHDPGTMSQLNGADSDAGDHTADLCNPGAIHGSAEGRVLKVK
jgi:hypothetical protein